MINMPWSVTLNDDARAVDCSKLGMSMQHPSKGEYRVFAVQ